jgi:hypothetical protein
VERPHRRKVLEGSVRLIVPFAVVATVFLAFSMAGNSPAARTETTAEAPVEFIYGGISPDKAKFTYKVKVNTDKPVEEVHMNLKEMDTGGKVLYDGALVWQNIVLSKRQPIEQGKTYEDYMMLNPGVDKVECSLKEVIFKDDTRWSPTASAAVTPQPVPVTKPSQANEAPRVTPSPTPKASTPLSAIQGEVESFIKSVYRDMEQNDVDKVLANFDKSVDYYAYGPKDKAFIAEQLRQYFSAFPVRSFSVSEVALQAPPSTSHKVSATFDVRYSLKEAASGTTTTGRSHVEWDLVKPDKIIKIVRFTGTSYPDAP